MKVKLIKTKYYPDLEKYINDFLEKNPDYTLLSVIWADDEFVATLVKQ